MNLETLLSIFAAIVLTWISNRAYCSILEERIKKLEEAITPVDYDCVYPNPFIAATSGNLNDHETD